MGILLSCKKCPLTRKNTEKYESTAPQSYHMHRYRSPSTKPNMPNMSCKQKGPNSPTVFLLPPPPARRPSRASAGGQSIASQARMMRNQQQPVPHPYNGGEVLYSVAHFHQQSVSLSPSLSPSSLYSNVGDYENVRGGMTIPAVYENVRQLPKPASTVVFSSTFKPIYTAD